jgi:hypothetical protein
MQAPEAESAPVMIRALQNAFPCGNLAGSIPPQRPRAAATRRVAFLHVKGLGLSPIIEPAR